MASLLQNLLGGGVKPESQGRRPTAVGDRDVASRDTVYRKPAARSDKTSSTKKAASGGGGGSKAGSLPRRAPIPTPRPDPNVTLGGTPTAGYGSPSTFPARPEVVPPQMPQMPQQLPGLPIELQDQAAMPNPALAGTPPGLQPPTMSPTSVPGPGRNELAALLKPGLQPPQQGSMLPGEDAMNQWGKQHLPWWLGGG